MTIFYSCLSSEGETLTTDSSEKENPLKARGFSRTAYLSPLKHVKPYLKCISEFATFHSCSSVTELTFYTQYGLRIKKLLRP